MKKTRNEDQRESAVKILSVVMTLFCLSLVSGLSEGTVWTLITKDHSGDVDVFIDQESVRRMSANTIRAWVKYRYSPPKRFDSKYITELAVYSEYYCTGESHKIIQSIGYFTDGTSETDSSERQAPVLLDDVTYKYLCK